MRRTAQGLDSAEKTVMWNFAMSEPKHFTFSLLVTSSRKILMQIYDLGHDLVFRPLAEENNLLFKLSVDTEM